MGLGPLITSSVSATSILTLILIFIGNSISQRKSNNQPYAELETLGKIITAAAFLGILSVILLISAYLNLPFESYLAIVGIGLLLVGVISLGAGIIWLGYTQFW